MRTSPAFKLAVTFFCMIVFGAALFLLFGFGEASGKPDMITALFTSTSAVCVTGLSVVDLSAEMGFRGQWIVLLLVQIGGLGVLTLSNWVLLSLRGGMDIHGSILTSETMGSLARLSPARFLNRVVLFTFLVESAGALVLFLRFLRDTSPGHALWLAIFHSVSAFCNAGFTLFGNSLCAFRGDPVVNLVVGFLVIAGGLGFVVAVDVGESIRSALAGRRRLLTFHSRVVIVVTGVLILAGFLAFAGFEWGNTLAQEPVHAKLFESFFLSMTARTAGFNTLPTGDLTNMTLMGLMLLMVIGASPGSTGGGVKTTTAAILWALIRGHLMNRNRAEVFGRTIPFHLVAKALAVLMLYIFTVILAMIVLQGLECNGLHGAESRGFFLEHLFEVISALSTVGLSTGVTERLSGGGLGVLIVCMFAGRVGPLVLASSLIGERRKLSYTRPEADVMVG